MSFVLAKRCKIYYNFLTNPVLEAETVIEAETVLEAKAVIDAVLILISFISD